MVELCQGRCGLTRESLQQNRILRGTKKDLMENCFEMFAEIAEMQGGCKKFHEQFGEYLMLALHGDSVNQTTIAEWLTFDAFNFGVEQLYLREYVDRMKENQNDICHVNGESMSQCIVEQIADVPFPQIMEEIVEVGGTMRDAGVKIEASPSQKRLTDSIVVVTSQLGYSTQRETVLHRRSACWSLSVQLCEAGKARRLRSEHTGSRGESLRAMCQRVSRGACMAPVYAGIVG